MNNRLMRPRWLAEHRAATRVYRQRKAIQRNCPHPIESWSDPVPEEEPTYFFGSREPVRFCNRCGAQVQG